MKWKFLNALTSTQVDLWKIAFIGLVFAAGFEAPNWKHTAETPPMIAETSLTPAGKPCSVMK